MNSPSFSSANSRIDSQIRASLKPLSDFLSFPSKGASLFNALSTILTNFSSLHNERILIPRRAMYWFFSFLKKVHNQIFHLFLNLLHKFD